MMMVSLTTKVPLSGQVCANPLCFLGGKLLLFLVDPSQGASSSQGPHGVVQGPEASASAGRLLKT